MSSKQNSALSIAILAFMYFIFGFVSWVNSILIPFFKIACELTTSQAYLVTVAFYIAYLVISPLAGLLLKKTGFKRGIMYGFFFLAGGALIFVPAAMSRIYGIFLAGLFTMGAGLAILQTAANPLVTIIGPIERAAQRMSIMGVCNKFAGIVSPLIFAAIILKVSDRELLNAIPTMDLAEKAFALDELTGRIIRPYACLSVLLVAAGLFIRYSSIPEINPEKENSETDAETDGKKSLFRFPYLILGAVALFLHVGTQVIAIDTIIGYATDAMRMDLLSARIFPSVTLTATIVGYLAGIVLIPRVISQTAALRICTVTGLVLSLCILFVPGHVWFKGYETGLSIWFLALLGLPNSLIYAGIWPLAIRSLGRFTKTGSSLLVMCLFGNGVFPWIYGYCAENTGFREAYWILTPCFLYMVFYAVYGHKITSWRKLPQKI
jgi:glucose/galactose transporter